MMNDATRNFDEEICHFFDIVDDDRNMVQVLGPAALKLLSTRSISHDRCSLTLYTYKQLSRHCCVQFSDDLYAVIGDVADFLWALYGSHRFTTKHRIRTSLESFQKQSIMSLSSSLELSMVPAQAKASDSRKTPCLDTPIQFITVSVIFNFLSLHYAHVKHDPTTASLKHLILKVAYLLPSTLHNSSTTLPSVITSSPSISESLPVTSSRPTRIDLTKMLVGTYVNLDITPAIKDSEYETRSAKALVEGLMRTMAFGHFKVSSRKTLVEWFAFNYPDVLARLKSSSIHMHGQLIDRHLRSKVQEKLQLLQSTLLYRLPNEKEYVTTDINRYLTSEISIKIFVAPPSKTETTVSLFNKQNMSDLTRYVIGAIVGLKAAIYSLNLDIVQGIRLFTMDFTQLTFQRVMQTVFVDNFMVASTEVLCALGEVSEAFPVSNKQFSLEDKYNIEHPSVFISL